MPRPPASLKVRALQWLAQREHSRQELRDKLLRLLRESDRRAAREGEGAGRGSESGEVDDAAGRTGAAEVDALLDWLSTRGYLSEQRFVESRVQARLARFGNLRIERELQQHGTPLDADARQTLKDSELSRARALWQRRYGTTAQDAAGRVRQMRFLTGRGFSPEVVRRVVRGDSGDSGDSGD